MLNPNNELSSESPSSAPSAKSAPFPKSADGAAVASSKGAVDGAHDTVDGPAQAGDDFVKQLVDRVHAAIDKFADAARPTVDRISGALSHPSAKASSLLGQAGDKKDAWASDVRDIVREHPIAAIAVALAAGAVYVRLTAAPRRESRDGVDD